MNAAFYEAARPQRFRILGVQLRDFSFGHEILLRSTENAFLSDKKPAFDDLAIAVAICGQPYESGREDLRDLDEMKAAFLKWRKKLSRRHGFLWLRSEPGFQAEDLIAFQEYLTEGMEWPHVGFKDGDAKPCRIPIEERVIVTLCSKMGVPLSEVLNMPRRQALWHYCSCMEMHNLGVYIRDKFEDMDLRKRANDVDRRVNGKGKWASAN